MSANHPVDKGANNNQDQNRTSVVHVRSGDGERSWERHPDNDEDEVHQGKDIN